MSRSDRVATTDDRLQAVIGQPSAPPTFAWHGVDWLRSVKGPVAHISLERDSEFMRAHEEMAHTRQGPSQAAVRSKYHREIKPGVWVDVYSVLTAWNVTNPADAHAIKKLLMPGARGMKDGAQDRREAIQSIERAIEIESERMA